MTSSNENIFPVTGHFRGEFTGDRWIPRTKAPVTQSFDIFSDLRLIKGLSKQSWGWWFETPSRPLWRHCNALDIMAAILADDIFNWILLNQNARIPIQISLKFVSKSPIDNTTALDQVMVWR